MQDWIDILDSKLSAGEAIAFVSAAEAGGINVFLGTTRGEKNSAGNELLALDYEAYNEMAISQLCALAQRARERWPIERLVILHRVGRVLVKESSVIIAVATPHRAEAFEACRFLIDALKAEAAIWKKEVWKDGSETWVEPDKKTSKPQMDTDEHR